jgi:hypothetical protein
MSTKPITPEEVVEVKKTTIPDMVIKAANELIVKYWNGRSSVFELKELIRTYRKMAGSDAVSEKKLTEYRWLDIEPTFMEVGWKVKYESPDRGSDDFEDYFEFTKK